ncbi:hypothetical protein CEXT_327131 [Caerostris extrusa]|uniref:Uncharacterized protein n=1 Tax=Caerostris extrusa TaxID=172846 RepID=A0AAV4Y6I2_CAEEX|nr:hypothetical protein CEXT_327131 [Caerostris extrusa]
MNGGLLATLRDATVPEPRWLVSGSRLRKPNCVPFIRTKNHQYERRKKKKKEERRKKAVFTKSANSIPSAQYDWNGCHLDDRICERGDRQTPLCPINGDNQSQISMTSGGKRLVDRLR